MKKVLIIAIALVCFMTGNTLMAAYQYENIIGLNDGAHSLYAMGNYDNVTLNFSGLSNSWKTLTVEATDTLGKTTTSTVAITGDSVNIGSISTGSDLKLYLGDASTVQGTADVNWKAWGSGWDTTVGTYDYLHFGANYGKWDSKYVTTTFTVSGTATPTPTPTGQPLPGALAALLVGGAGAGAFAIRRKRTAAAR